MLLMACCLHDAGMGISSEEFDLFVPRLDLEAYFRAEGEVPRDRIIGTSTRSSAPFSSTDTRPFWTCRPLTTSLR